MRQFVAQSDFDSKGLLCVSGKDFKYLKQVLRLAPGDMVSVRTPDGSLKNSTVCKIEEDSRKVVFQLCGDSSAEHKENQPVVDNGIKWWLFMFVPKSSKFELIVRQAAECGVEKIIPVRSEYSQSGAEKMNFKGDRFERIIREARQQSGSAVNTTVENCMTVKEACRFWQENKTDSGLGCVLYERTEKTSSVHKAVNSVADVKICALVCGAEGGISPEEIELLSNNGFVPVHFETNILRCETAALYGIAALQSAVTEKKVWQCKE